MLRAGKYIFGILALFSLHQSLQAQFKFGIHGGMGSSNYRGEDFPDDNTQKYGIVAGMYFEREINMTISVGTELNYEQKGTSYFDELTPGNVLSIDSKVNYFTLPVLIKAYLGYNAYYYFYMGASASYAYQTTNNVYATAIGHTITYEAYFPYEIRKSDASILGGFGVNFREIILDFRYQHGIVDIYKGSNVPVIRNMFFSVTLGYSIYKKKKQYCFNPWRRVK